MTTAQTFFVERLETPIGLMLVVTDADGALRAVDWSDHEDQMKMLLRRQYPGVVLSLNTHSSTSAASAALRRYFAGDVKAINELAVTMGGTDFQKRVWNALQKIPVGETISYSVLAARVGQPTAVRAVGLANGSNVIDIVVPCHRVVGANGSLTGYGGGLERKRWLLDHERKWTTTSVNSS